MPVDDARRDRCAVKDNFYASFRRRSGLFFYARRVAVEGMHAWRPYVNETTDGSRFFFNPA